MNPVVEKKTDNASSSPVLSQTSLVPSDGTSPLLEAHPGSPVDLTGRRPSLAMALASASLCRPSERQIHDPYRFQTSPEFIGHSEELLRRDGVAAKEDSSMESLSETEAQPSQKRMQVTGPQSFYIPARVPEHDEVHTISAPVCVSEDDMSCDTAMKFLCPNPEYSGTWITASPLTHGSRSSLATTTTLVSDTPHTRASLTIDTSVAGSDGTASMLSSSAASVISSTLSTETTTTDIYGWEEELDRKSSTEGSGYKAWEREPPRPLPSGGRSGYQATRGLRPVPRGGEEFQQYRYKPVGIKRRSLLYRVLNLSREHKRAAVIEEERDSPSGAFVETPKQLTPLTSAIGIDS